MKKKHSFRNFYFKWVQFKLFILLRIWIVQLKILQREDKREKSEDIKWVILEQIAELDYSLQSKFTFINLHLIITRQQIRKLRLMAYAFWVERRADCLISKSAVSLFSLDDCQKWKSSVLVSC